MQQPNMILIFPDQWRGDAMGCAGHSVVRTPYIDYLAANGIRFTNAYR
jgi:arylsulfatase A-like enzyme